jgi:hypothetical protein
MSVPETMHAQSVTGLERPRYTDGVAYGFRADAGILPLDLGLTAP